MKNETIIIVGTRRAGTTFLGKLLSVSTKNNVYIEEPFNPVRGIKGFGHVWYPYITNNANAGLKKNIINLFNRKKVKFKNAIVNDQTKESNLNAPWIDVFMEIFKNNSKEPLKRRFLRTIFKSNHFVSYIKARIQSNKNLVFKDALMSLSLQFILEHFPNTKVVFIFRNPMGFYYSMKRLNWAISLQNFLQQQELVKDYPFIGNLKSETLEDKIINEWYIVNKIMLDKVNKDDRIICVSHEKLSKDPEGQMHKIVNQLVLGDMDNDKIIEFTTGDHSSKKTKDVKRDSKKEINSWKNKLSEEEIDYIQKRTMKLYQELSQLAI